MNSGHTNNFRDLLGYELVEKHFKNIKELLSTLAKATSSIGANPRVI